MDRRHTRHTRRTWLALLALGAFAAASCSDGGTAPDALRGHIAFVSERDGNDEIYVMRADGAGVRRLTYDPALDGEPRWSPDGRQIAFSSSRTTTADAPQVRWDIFVMDADGANLRQLTSDGTSVSPAWSPDGRQIAFRRRVNGNDDIYAVDTDGTNLRRLTDDPADDLQPAWSPDGAWIAFVRGTLLQPGLGTRRLFLMRPDGTEQHPITMSELGTVEDPAWAPDGQHIAATLQYRAADAYDGIIVLTADGSQPTLLIDNGRHGFTPAWSPDGRHIAFSVWRAGPTASFEIVTTSPTPGAAVRTLTADPAADVAPTWR